MAERTSKPKRPDPLRGITPEQLEERRFRALDLLREGHLVETVAKKLRVGYWTVWHWLQLSVDPALLKAKKRTGNAFRVKPDQVRTIFRQCDDWTAHAFAAAIFEVTGVQYSRSHSAALLKACGATPAAARRARA